ncbi:MAG TPA: hypothetical protein VFI27_21280 [candidate division Zixibacteria bacterium]|nr:hypothetical protein [candidate division Zixibacteria bacterium]
MTDYQTSVYDDQRQTTASPKGHEATFIDSSIYSLSLPKVAARFQEAKIHRTTRTLQRYCENGSFEARKYNTDKGTLWLANPQSVELKIKEILELEDAARLMAPTDDDTSTPPDVSHSQVNSVSGENDDTTIDDNQRQSSVDTDRRTINEAVEEPPTARKQATTHEDNKYVSVPVGVVDALTDQLAEKDKQLERRDLELMRIGEERTQDRILLSQALHLIHGENFTPALWGKTEAEEPQTITETQPEPTNRHQDREGDNPQASSRSYGV